MSESGIELSNFERKSRLINKIKMDHFFVSRGYCHVIMKL